MTMIKAVCVQDCYLRIQGATKPKHYQRGQVAVFNLPEAPDHFMFLSAVEVEKDDELDEVPQTSKAVGEGAEFSFADATEEVLLAADYPMATLIKYAKEKYNLILPKSAHKTVIVAKFIDARYRAAVTDSGLQNANMALIEGIK
jgi:hypothetical protein